MALGRSKKALVPVPAGHEEAPVSLVAAALRITSVDGRGWPTYKFGDDSWQNEAWRLYDVIGELRFVANWIGSALSRVRLYVAEVDKNGRVQGETKRIKVAALADNMLGGPARRPELIRLAGINLTVAGDAYFIGRSTDDPQSDEWYVLSRSEMKRYTGGGENQAMNIMGDPGTMDPQTDMVIRVWTPHPRRTLWSDSPTRGAMPMLFEIERLTRFVFAQIDSRLVSAGLFPIPKETTFPDEEGNSVEGAEALTQTLLRFASASLKGEGTAAGVVPMFVEMPLEALGKLSNIQFTSELSAKAMELRTEAIRRFALAMDIDPSILSGAGEANHWGAWQIMEGQIKVHIEPLAGRICDALTQAFLVPALKSIKEDPERYVLWYDTAPLTVRPERLKDTREMYDAGLVSAQAVRNSGDYKDSDAPSDEESAMKFVRELMLRDPNLFQIPDVRRVAGISDAVLPPDKVFPPPQGGGAGPPPPPAPPTGISDTSGPPIPQVTQAQNAPGGPPPSTPPPPAGITAAASVTPLNVFVVSNATVLRALELAGKRLVGNQHRSEFTCPPYELHTKIPVKDEQHAQKVLANAWDHLSVLVEHVDPTLDTEALRKALDQYCTALLTHKRPHHVLLLQEYLTRSGFLHESQ
jgi:hypothetical protein